jgi:hypothetical protein
MRVDDGGRLRAGRRYPAVMASSRHGPAFLYVLRMSGAEDLLKVGLTADPVARWSGFHRRWFEAFDLERTLLVETETRGDAQRLETALHRTLKAYGCPVPLTMRAFAGGATEWYRGASAAAREFVARCEADGFTVHMDARPHVAGRLGAQRHVVASVLDQAVRNDRDGVLTPEEIEAVRDLADAHRAFGFDLSDMLPADALAILRLDG